MAHTNSLEAEIDSLKKRPQAPEMETALEEKQKELSKVKLMKPFEYSHQGFLHIFDRAEIRVIGVYRER